MTDDSFSKHDNDICSNKHVLKRTLTPDVNLTISIYQFESNKLVKSRGLIIKWFKVHFPKTEFARFFP